VADERDLIRSRIDIVELVSQRVSLKKAGKSWTGLCPFHDERNPSFRVNPELGVYKCWSCGVGGDIFTWVMETEHVDFVEALRILAKQAGVELKKRDKREPSVVEAQEGAMAEAQAYYREQLTKSTHAKEYCEKRGIDQATIDFWELGYAPDINGALASHLQKNNHPLALCKDLFLVDKDASGGFYDRFRGRLMFPIKDERGKLVAFGGRILGDGQPKYINSSDTPLYSKSRVLYGMDKAKQAMSESKQGVLVEGYLDVIACHSAGVKTAIASLGTSLADDHVRLLKRWCDEVVVLYDSDAAGQKAAERACDLLTNGGLKVRVALIPSGKDPDTLLREQGAEAVRRMVEKPLTEAAYLIAQLESRIPATQDEFWDGAVEILAKAKKHQEIVGLIDSLVPRFPYTQDQSVARLQIERMIRAVRVRLRRGENTRTVTAPGRDMRNDLKGFEAAVFKALLVPELRKEAWATCNRIELFVTGAGRKLAESVIREFPDGIPDDKASTWLPKVIEPELRDQLLESGREVLPRRDLVLIERETFLGSVERMEALLEQRSRGDLKSQAKGDMEARKTLLDRLKKAKGGDEP